MKSSSLQNLLNKNIVIFVLTILFAQFLFGYFQLTHTLDFYKNDALESHSILADSLKPSLLFSSKQDFYDITNTLDFENTFLTIHAFDKNGKTFAHVGVQYKIDEEKFNKNGAYYTFDHLILSKELIIDGEIVGHLVAIKKISILKDLIINEFQLLVFAIIFLLIIAYMYSKRLQATISEPLHELTRVITNITADPTLGRSFEASMFSQFEEIYKMSLAFKGMIEDVSLNREQLEDLNSGLEDIVDSKTRELTRALNNLKQFQKKLVAQEKLASLGSLSAGIAHEIKNPLNLINNSAILIDQFVANTIPVYQEKISNNTMTDEDIKYLFEDLDDISETCRIIVRNGKRADQIVKSMLMQSRSGKAELTNVNLTSIVEEAINLSFHAMRAKKPYDVDIIKDIDLVDNIYIYPQEIERALINILDNSFYAMRAKKDDHKDYEAILKVSLKADFKAVTLTIRDNGIGIPNKVMAKVLEPFFTTKPTGAGTGLGMSMVNDIVMAHEGEFNIISEEDIFTEVVIKLPIINAGDTNERQD